MEKTVEQRSHETTRVHLNGNGHTRAVSDLLAPYDIRLHAEWAQRRTNRHLLRNFARVGILLLTDIAGLLLAYLAAIVLRQDVLPGHVGGLGPLTLNVSLFLLPAALVIHLLSLAAFNAYAPGSHRRNYHRIFLAILVGTLLLYFGSTLYATALPSRLLFVLAGVSAACSVASLRWLLDRAVIIYRLTNDLGRAALLVGPPDQIPRVRAHIEDTVEANIRIERSLTFDELATPPLSEFSPDRLTAFLLRRDIEVVVVAGDPPAGMANRLLDRCLEAGCQVMLVPSVLHEIPNPVKVEDLRGLFALAVQVPRLGLPRLALKRAFDLFCATLGLLVLSPLFALIAVAIKLDSPGSVFFKQRRVGVGGRVFWIYKFRSMVADAEAHKRQLQHLNQYRESKFFKIKGDPRITRMGRLLRRTSLDELPQLINVIRGEMSLVGPRPPVPEEVADYSEHHLQRLSVTPGITGLWQVKGRSDILDFEEVVRLDLEYISTWSLWKDLAILLRTVPAVFHSNGAA